MKRLLPLVIVICAAIGCAPKHNLEIRLKGFHNDTLILGVMPLSDYIVNNYDNMQTQTLVAQDGVIKTNIPTDDSAQYFFHNPITPSIYKNLKRYITNHGRHCRTSAQHFHWPVFFLW